MSVCIYTHTSLVYMHIYHMQTLLGALNIDHLILNKEHLIHIKLQKVPIIHTEDHLAPVVLNRTFNMPTLLYHLIDQFLYYVHKVYVHYIIKNTLLFQYYTVVCVH